MTPNDFLIQLNQLPPDTPITAHHLISILSILANNNNVKETTAETPYSSLDREDVITEEVLAKWINKNVQTLRNWRGIGKGPKFIKDSKSVNYRVGTVMDWLKSREVQSTTQADTLKFGSLEYDSVFASIYINDIATPFFETIKDTEEEYLDMNFTGYQVVWTEKDSFASLLLSSFELNIEAEKIVDEILRITNTGTHINKLQTVLINNEAHSINLSHLIAQNTYDFDQYTLLVQDLYNAGLDFHLKDNHNQTSLDIANTNNNSHLVNMINSFDLHKKLRNELILKKQ